MKIDPKIILGIGIGFIFSSMLFIMAQPFQESGEALQQHDNDAKQQKEKNDLVDGLDNKVDQNKNNSIDAKIEDKLTNVTSEQNEEESKSATESDVTDEKDIQKDEKDFKESHLVIDVSEGLAADEIALLLEEHGVLEESEELLDILVEEDKVTSLKYGEFQFPMDSEPEYVAEQLISGP